MFPINSMSYLSVCYFNSSLEFTYQSLRTSVQITHTCLCYAAIKHLNRN
jgi:hypothetical protein